jgi:putative DNA primase/helicase
VLTIVNEVAETTEEARARLLAELEPRRLAQDPGDDRPRISLNAGPFQPALEMHALVEKAAHALGHAQEVFCRDGHLVDAGPVEAYVSKRKPKPNEGQRAQAPSFGIRQLPATEVQRHLSRVALWSRWVKSKGRGEGGLPREVHADPPMSLAIAVSNMGRWETVRPLAGVLTAPSIRPDGSIIQEPGWDEATRFLYEPARRYPLIPEAPTQEDARQALAALRAVFAKPGDGFDGFPFATDAERDVPIANVLTLIARPAIDGCVPAFVYDASTPGTGKGLIADTVCTIATGEDMPKGVFTDKQEELSKHLGSLVLAGVAVAGFDNIDQRMALCGGVFDAVLTARRPQLRILGKSEAPAIDWHAVVMVTGNNVQITGDTERRCIKCRQEPSVERPELRTNFRVPNLLAHVREHRPELVRAALTLLRSYFVAGCPSVGVAPLGSFEAWSRLVAGAIVFAGGHDVTQCIANKNGASEDPELEAAGQLLKGMYALGRGLSSSELIEAAYAAGWNGHPSGEESLQEPLDVLTPRKDRNGRPSPKAVGHALKRIRGRVFDGLKLLSKPSPKGGCSVEWYVVAPCGSGVSGVPGVLSTRHARAEISEGMKSSMGQGPPETPSNSETRNLPWSESNALSGSKS